MSDNDIIIRIAEAAERANRDTPAGTGCTGVDRFARSLAAELRASVKAEPASPYPVDVRARLIPTPDDRCPGCGGLVAVAEGRPGDVSVAYCARCVLFGAYRNAVAPVPRGHCGRCDRCGWPFGFVHSSGCAPDCAPGVCSQRPMIALRTHCAGCGAPYEVEAPVASLAERSERLRATTGALSWGRRSASDHPDACECNAGDIVPHVHYPDAPYACARCGCDAYNPRKEGDALAGPDDSSRTRPKHVTPPAVDSTSTAGDTAALTSDNPRGDGKPWTDADIAAVVADEMGQPGDTAAPVDAQVTRLQAENLALRREYEGTDVGETLRRSAAKLAALTRAVVDAGCAVDDDGTVHNRRAESLEHDYKIQFECAENLRKAAERNVVLWKAEARNNGAALDDARKSLDKARAGGAARIGLRCDVAKAVRADEATEAVTPAKDGSKVGE